MSRAILLAGVLWLVLAARGAAPLGADPPPVTARLGISAGDAIASAALGTTGSDLRRLIPELWDTADQLGVSIESASVGQGFWSDDGELDSEPDLDLVVSGQRPAIEALAGRLGPAWDQSTVFIWYPTPGPGEQATATIPLPGGAHPITAAIYQAMLPEISGGAHVRYAGPDSLIFIARTDGGESDAAFVARMARLVGVLRATGVETGPVEPGWADVTVETTETYDRYAGPRVSAAAMRQESPPATTRLCPPRSRRSAGILGPEVPGEVHHLRHANL